MHQLKYRLWRHNDVKVVTLQIFLLPLCRTHQAWQLPNFMIIGSITTKLWWGPPWPPHNWRFKKSPCQIGLRPRKWINDQCYGIQKDLLCNAKHGSTKKVVHHSRLLKTSGCGLLCNYIMDHVAFIIQVNFLLEVTHLFLWINKQGKEIISLVRYNKKEGEKNFKTWDMASWRLDRVGQWLFHLTNSYKE